MKVFVSVDLEGIAGVVGVHQIRRGATDYGTARHLMAGEANAAVAGAFAAGATTVVVSDGHADMANLTASDLDPRAELLSGSPRVPYGMMQGLTEEFSVAIFIGYHAAAGTTDGVLAHTYSGKVCHEVRLDGVSVSEAELNAMLAAGFGVPVGLVTGDDKVCAAVRDRLPAVRTLPVKQGLGVTAARSLHPDEARRRIECAVREVVACCGRLRAPMVSGPHRLEADLSSVAMAELCQLVPGTTRLSGRTVAFTAPDISDGMRCLIAWIQLGQSLP